MSNYEKAKESDLGFKLTTPRKRDHAASQVHVSRGQLAWTADKTDHDLKGVTIKKYPDDYSLEPQK